MTLTQWRAIACWCILASAVVLIVSVRAKSRAEADAARALAELHAARTSLADASALARAGLTASAAHRRTVDSLWTLINARRAALVIPVRQHAVVPVVSLRDTMAVVHAITTLRAENDTLRADLSEARVALEQERAAVDALVTSARLHATADDARFAAIDSATATAAAHVATATQAIRPRWWKRLGRGVVATTKAAALLAAGVMIGRHT